VVVSFSIGSVVWVEVLLVLQSPAVAEFEKERLQLRLCLLRQCFLKPAAAVVCEITDAENFVNT
jgi:hypothetical protein